MPKIDNFVSKNTYNFLADLLQPTRLRLSGENGNHHSQKDEDFIEVHVDSYFSI